MVNYWIYYINNISNTDLKYLIIFILITGCVKSEYGFKPAPPGLTATIVEQLMKVENE
tara:strand:+ start:527 stop:700 length:174 start_codon:yes stop_codon:yes gene_type:complete